MFLYKPLLNPKSPRFMGTTPKYGGHDVWCVILIYYDIIYDWECTTTTRINLLYTNKDNKICITKVKVLCTIPIEIQVLIMK
jgi:hypothetical protein